MKRISVQLALVALLTVAANATSLCTSDTLAFYVANYQAGCLVGDKLFSNFGYSSASVNDANINVVPDDGGSFEGLFFSSGSFSTFPNGTKSATLSYTVSAPGPLISGAVLTGTGRIVSGTNGTITVTENIQQGAVDIPGSPLSVSAAGSGLATLDFIGAGGTYQTSLNVTTTITVQTGAGTSATFSQLTETFNQITAPEPMQSVLIGSGFLLLGLVSRKRRCR